MNKKLLFSFGSLLVSLLLVVMAATSVSASPQTQVFYQTPTPDADGRILYTVGAGDTCISISLLTGIDVSELRLLNGLDEACTVAEGQQLLLGTVDVSQPTAGPTATSEADAQPSPTPFMGNGEVCINLFADLNGNATAEDGEGPIGGGAVSITNRAGDVSRTGETTVGEEPLCFTDLPEGEYNISVAPPEGFNPTTSMNYPLPVHPGDSSIIDFGAQISSQAPVEADPTPTSPMLAIVGGLLVLAGAGMGVYVWRAKRP
jgi:hypothetical protein